MNPHLPQASDCLGPDHTRKHRKECGARYYLACLEYAQSLTRQKKPAQAILQLNKAFMADVENPPYPLPYEALIWLITQRGEGIFIGNPVRHFQHLATRMSGPRAELRSWRAWACFHLSQQILPRTEFPKDEQQLSREGLVIPSFEEVLKNLPKSDILVLARTQGSR